MSAKLKIQKPFVKIENTLGECPLWHPEEKKLYWVDIEEGHLFRYDPFTSDLEIFDLGIQTGSFAFRKQGGLLLATAQGFAFWDEHSGTQANFAALYSADSEIMMNDGRVDSLGRFWAGSKGPSDTAALFLLEPDLSFRKILPDITISNGIDWSQDNKYCYYVDSGKRAIFRFNFNLETGSLSSPEVFYSLDGENTSETPDGLVLDSAGNIWCAFWDGYRLVQFTPDGEVLSEIELPIGRPTSMTFGGDDLRTLYITSARTGLTKQELQNQPLAGSLFAFRTEIPGRLANYFLG